MRSQDMQRKTSILPCFVVVLNAVLMRSSPSGDSTNAFTSAAWNTETHLNTGARVMPSATTTEETPPLAVMARAPLFVLAMSAPSVVAIGTKCFSPFTRMGPTTPTGTGT